MGSHLNYTLMTETETTVAPPPLSMVHFLHLLLVNHSLKFLNKKFPLISSHYVYMYHLTSSQEEGTVQYNRNSGRRRRESLNKDRPVKPDDQILRSVYK